MCSQLHLLLPERDRLGQTPHSVTTLVDVYLDSRSGEAKGCTQAGWTGAQHRYASTAQLPTRLDRPAWICATISRRKRSMPNLLALEWQSPGSIFEASAMNR